ncbi:response regulator [Natranaerobius trueperi]|uniref:Stage 0 sporulation protein A homolog n=1 Tax=Natranaerobius trueperi TaxID=759412 RepID=A0A226BZX5_9FIRM|nr:response regulator [Natranaerobius trueperi]OWZ84573.1 hypothetical protein CDO51_02090 [Natranaerobius trueperi]
MNNRILVVDDQAGIRMLIKEVLEEEGYPVEVASTGEVFLDKVKSHNFDLFIVDLKIPDYEGYQLFKELQTYVSLSKVIVISGLGCPDTKKEIKSMGIASYIEKPFDLQELIKKVEKSLDQITA